MFSKTALVNIVRNDKICGNIDKAAVFPDVEEEVLIALEYHLFTESPFSFSTMAHLLIIIKAVCEIFGRIGIKALW